MQIRQTKLLRFSVKKIFSFPLLLKVAALAVNFFFLQKPFLIRAKVPASGAQRHRADTADYITAQLQLFFFLS